MIDVGVECVEWAYDRKFIHTFETTIQSAFEANYYLVSLDIIDGICIFTSQTTPPPPPSRTGPLWEGSWRPLLSWYAMVKHRLVRVWLAIWLGTMRSDWLLLPDALLAYFYFRVLVSLMDELINDGS